MTIDFLPKEGPPILLGLGDPDRLTIYIGGVAAEIDPESAIELAQLLTRAARLQLLRRERQQLNAARQRRP